MAVSKLLLKTTRLIGLTAALAMVVPSPAWAQNPPKKEISDRVSEGLGKLRDLTNPDAPRYAEALALINQLIANARPESYDVAVLSQVKVQVLLQQTNYGAAIEPMEVALRLGRTYDFFEARQMLELTQILAQLYFQEATEANDTTTRNSYFDSAYKYLKQYLDEAEDPSEDSLAFASSLLYTRATADTANIDLEVLKEAKQYAEEGLLKAITPRENFYVLILAVLQQLGENEEAAKILETLVKKKPDSKQYWNQLQATYINLAGNAVDNSDAAYRWNVMTVMTIERAQENGLLTEPSNHFNMIGILFNIGRFPEAITLLEEGLTDGKVENTRRNWELLATSYQQTHKELKAIETYERAAKQFPTEGTLEFQAANIYYMLDKMPEAYRHGKAALAKGNLDNIGATEMFVAYIGYELRDYEEALRYAKSAQENNASNADQLVDAIERAIEEREANLNATI